MRVRNARRGEVGRRRGIRHGDDPDPGMLLRDDAQRLRVGASSGIQEMTISHPDAAPGRYFVNSFLTEPGQTWTQALAWSAVRQITLLPASYLDWVQWRWGVVLGNDLILPTQDADGDGANNDEERIAHTAPLNPGNSTAASAPSSSSKSV